MKGISLRARLTLLLAVAALVSLGIAARVVDWRADTEMRQRFDASLLARAQAFAALVSRGESGVEIDVMADRAARFPAGASDDWYAVTCEGRVLAKSDPTPPPIAVGNAPVFANARLADGHDLRMVALRFQPMAEDGHEQVGVASGQAAATCSLRYALDRRPLADILHALDWTLLGSLLGACVLVLLLTPWLVRRGLRPLDALDRAMAAIGPDAPGGRLPASRTTELAPLVTRFNEVLMRMDAGLARERQFASGLAHEFRTRIAELRALVDVERRHPSGRDLDAVLAEVGSINAELEATVTALLQLTRIQSGLTAARPESLALGPLLARLRARHQGAAQARGVQVTGTSGDAPAVTVKADPALLEIVLDNLLGNAVAYAPSGSAVTLHATATRIDVCNAAPALQAEDIANFGQRFWRKDAQGAGHAGLGLAAILLASVLHRCGRRATRRPPA
ncbi:MAG TPA: sensor histidine kinase N-terminal domain-containing protein [Rhodanobacteraceae bacterium]|nr:sensor histidine kinase N-terminal domain-containing protein [Rhodanobacteraceae bacterium]